MTRQINNKSTLKFSTERSYRDLAKNNLEKKVNFYFFYDKILYWKIKNRSLAKPYNLANPHSGELLRSLIFSNHAFLRTIFLFSQCSLSKHLFKKILSERMPQGTLNLVSENVKMICHRQTLYSNIPVSWENRR